MTIKHKFINTAGMHKVLETERISKDDICIYCNIKITLEDEHIFDKILNNYDINSDYEDYLDDLNFCYILINKKYPCITEEEYMIKELLE